MQGTICNSVPDAVQADHLYAVVDVNEDGFVIVKCTAVLLSNFKGIVMQKCTDDSSVLFYKQSPGPPKTFEKTDVVTSLISVCVCSADLYSVERSEIESVLLLINA